jgi:metal-dependent HD superfamily phosphatase/phosphodiesterase
MTYEEIIKNEEVRALIAKGNENLGTLGFTDHSTIHTGIVAKNAGKILEAFGYSQREIELAKIAGFMHDMGNAINRKNHAEYGALLANDILRNTDMPLEDRIIVMSAIGNHDESTGKAVDAVSAALIIADKTDVRRERVRTKEPAAFDIHDRVNYAVTGQNLRIDAEDKVISLNLQIDEKICTMYEYFDIFLGRMLMSRSAAEVLGATFKIKVNGIKIL